jgi:hypothetical protein
MFRNDRFRDSREIVMGYLSRVCFIRCRCFYYCPRVRRLLAVPLAGRLSCHLCLRQPLYRSSVPGLRQSLLLARDFSMNVQILDHIDRSELVQAVCPRPTGYKTGRTGRGHRKRTRATDLLSNTINSPTKPHSLVSKKRSSVFTPVNRTFRHSLSPSPRKCSHITSFCVCSMGRRKAFIKADHSSSKTSSPDAAARFLPPQSIMGWLCSRMPHNLGFADEPYQASGVRSYREAVGCGGSASRPIPISEIFLVGLLGLVSYANQSRAEATLTLHFYVTGTF